jgi:Domain of unknown function (DUF4158)
MTPEAYPHFSQEVSPEELMACYTLDNTDWQLLHQARGVPNRFGLAVLLKTFQHLGYFVERLSEVPPGIIAHLAQQLLLLPHVLNAYDDTHPVKRHRHRAWIRRHVGTHAYRPQQHEPRLRQVLLDGPAQEAQFPHALLPAAVAQLRAWKIELPARQSLLRLLASVLEEADRTLFRTLAARLSDQQKQQLDGFLQAEQPHTQSPFHRVKQSPGRPSVATLHEEAQKLQQLRAFGVEPQVLAGISPRKAAYLANLVGRYTNTDMARFAADKRYALLAAFIVDRCTTITDQIVDVFLTLMRKLSSKSEEQLGREIVREVKEGQDHHELLYELSILLLAHPQGIVDEVVFSRIPKAQLEDVVQTKGKRRRSYRLRHYDVMSQKFAHHYGRALSLVLQHLRFQTSSSHQWLLRAIAAVTGHLGSRKWYLDEETPMGDMSESWQRCEGHPGG